MVNNILRSGPGELLDVVSIIPDGDKLKILDSGSPKLSYFHRESGEFIKDRLIDENIGRSFLEMSFKNDIHLYTVVDMEYIFTYVRGSERVKIENPDRYQDDMYSSYFDNIGTSILHEQQNKIFFIPQNDGTIDEYDLETGTWKSIEYDDYRVSSRREQQISFFDRRKFANRKAVLLNDNLFIQIQPLRSSNEYSQKCLYKYNISTREFGDELCFENYVLAITADDENLYVILSEDADYTMNAKLHTITNP